MRFYRKFCLLRALLFLFLLFCNTQIDAAALSSGEIEEKDLLATTGIPLVSSPPAAEPSDHHSVSSAPHQELGGYLSPEAITGRYIRDVNTRYSCHIQVRSATPVKFC